MALSRRKKALGMLAGIVLMGVPMAAFNYGLHEFIERQGKDDVETSAQRTISVVEARISLALTTLDRLGNEGVASCAPAHLAVLRRATFTVSAIKELSVIDGAGTTLCSALGIEQGQHNVIASQRVVADGEVLMEVLQIGTDAVIRLRRADKRLAALVAADLTVQATSQANLSGAHARLMLRDGTTIAIAGTAPPEAESAASRLTATIQSDRYGLTATVSMPRANVLTAVSHLEALGIVITGVISVLILVFALLVLWGAKRNPIEEITAALEVGEFVPYYQPIVNIQTGKLRGAEVLARWRKPDGTIVTPADFIPLMESSGLILELTRGIMRKARDEVGAAYQLRPHLHLAFNLAAQHLADERIIAELTDVFAASPVRLAQVVVEVTERQPLENLTQARRVIAALQGIGVRIAIDDVGSGHSGLSYILKLGVDVLKIDKMFVDAVGSDRNSSKIIETLVDLAGTLRMDVIAEGVETFEQVEYLRKLGIAAAQGFVFAPPLPGSSFLQLVEAADLAPVEAEPSPSRPADDISGRNRIEAA